MEKNAEEKTAEEKTVDEKTAEEKTAEEKTVEEKTAEEKKKVAEAAGTVDKLEEFTKLLLARNNRANNPLKTTVEKTDETSTVASSARTEEVPAAAAGTVDKEKRGEFTKWEQRDFTSNPYALNIPYSEPVKNIQPYDPTSSTAWRNRNIEKLLQANIQPYDPSPSSTMFL